MSDTRREIDLEADIPTLEVEREHAEHVVVDALSQYCWEGECDHDEDACPWIAFDTCVDCMDEDGAGRDAGEWEGRPLLPWPHPGSAGWTETAPDHENGDAA